MVKLIKVRELLQEIEREQGIVTPSEVVKRAVSPKSPIHSLFEWDDSEAARSYRLWQARQLITRVTVEVDGSEINDYHNIRVEINGQQQQGYVSAERIVSDERLHEQVVETALQEIKYWQNKYSTIKQLGLIINKKELSNLERKIK